MKAPAIKIEGVLIIGGVLIALYLIYKTYSAGSAVVSALNSVGEELGGDVYTAINGDANAQVQTTTQTELAALKAAGSPLPGTAAYNNIVSQYNPAQVVINSGGSGG